jgi:hypothetical protein
VNQSRRTRCAQTPDTRRPPSPSLPNPRNAPLCIQFDCIDSESICLFSKWSNNIRRINTEYPVNTIHAFLLDNNSGSTSSTTTRLAQDTTRF